MEFVLDHKVNCEQTEGSTFGAIAVDEDCAVFATCFFDEADYCIHDVGVDYVLYVVFCPVKGKEAHAFDGCIVRAVSACAVDDMCDLIECEPLDVLVEGTVTCAMTSSPMKMESLILTGIETSS